jgi:hypothetical protein
VTFFVVDDQFKSEDRRLFPTWVKGWQKNKGKASPAAADLDQTVAVVEGAAFNFCPSHGIQGIDSYNIQSNLPARTIRWNVSEKVVEYSLSQGGSSTKGIEKVIKIEPVDIQLISIWAACRAALWLSSLGSYPLLKFIKELDEFIFIL